MFLFLILICHSYFSFFFIGLLRREIEAAGTIYESRKYVDCEQESQVQDQSEEKSIFHNHDILIQSID